MDVYKDIHVMDITDALWLHALLTSVSHNIQTADCSAF
jgi:hypothetical protein